MTAVARLFAFTLMLVALGSGSACLTTLCLNALCGDAVTASTSTPSIVTPEVTAPSLSKRSDHNCNLMRF